jgi:hypothetical protein
MLFVCQGQSNEKRMYAPKVKGKKPAPKQALVVKEKICVRNRLQTRHVLIATWGGACLPSACLVSAGDTRLLIGCAFEGQSFVTTTGIFNETELSFQQIQ